MTQGEKRFNAIKDEYIKHYNRLNRVPLLNLFYKGGLVHVISNIMPTTYKIGKFEEMCITLSLCKDLKPLKPVAKLVSITLTTRVIVDESDDEVAILDKAKRGFQAKLDNNELLDNLESIEDDKELPYGTLAND